MAKKIKKAVGDLCGRKKGDTALDRCWRRWQRREPGAPKLVRVERASRCNRP